MHRPVGWFACALLLSVTASTAKDASAAERKAPEGGNPAREAATDGSAPVKDSARKSARGKPAAGKLAPSKATADQASLASPAGKLVQQALEAESAGQPEERAKLMERAVSSYPDYAPAHWAAGEIRLKDRWLPVDEAMKEIAASGVVEKYRRKRAGARRTFKDQVQLGDWCAAEGLVNHARLHWMEALALEPDSRAVMSKLGLVMYQGRPVPAETVELIEQQQNEQLVAAKKWAPPLKKLMNEIEADRPKIRQAAEKKLQEFNDPAVVPTLEELIANAGPEFGVAAIGALVRTPGQEATDTLMRMALLSQHPEVRVAASQALHKRSLYAVVPTLMGMLRAPVEIAAEQTVGENQSTHRIALFQEGPLASKAFVSAGGHSHYETIHVRRNRGEVERQVADAPDVTLAEDTALVEQAAAYSLMAMISNANVIAALTATTGQYCGDKPTDWWTWWMNYNEIYLYPQKPIQVTSRDYTPPPSFYKVTYSSCFVAGTKVWTMTGPVPIERMQAGDCVLSQHPATGELAFKPVLATTVRPTSPVRKIKTDGDSIRATLGHPFWVSGLGWRMTKELKAGEKLHTVKGPVEIMSAESDGEAVCYNLVVADFGNYFVGENKVLVHDNTIRDVTPALVPGLVVK
jgi:hypothetical protein